METPADAAHELSGRQPSIPGGRPRWAVLAAYGAVLSVLPSAVWRVAVGIGVPLGWSDAQLASQNMPGSGTAYVVVLSIASITAAALTLGLVRPWGEVVPAWVPLLGGRRIPTTLATALSISGAVLVITICVLSVINWGRVSGFADQPGSPWALIMIAAYLPALLWGPLLLVVTWSYWRHRRSIRP